MKTQRMAGLPLLYTQVIGSLPRPRFILDLLARREKTAPAEFDRRMDELVLFAIRLQEEAGLDVVSDGEWRRSHYIGEFLKRIGGFERCRKFEHQGEIKYTDVVTGRMSPGEPCFAPDARFLAQNATRRTKFALPGPFLVSVRYWHEDYSRAAYPTRANFMEHLTEILRQEARAIVAEGIDVLQLDDPALTYYCDRQLMSGEGSHDERLRRNWNIDEEFPRAVEAINHIAGGLKAEVHLHCCHSVYKRRSDVSGDYKPILPRLAGAKIDRVNLEFAYSGTGDISDLELLPAHLGVGLGVVDVRGEALQDVGEIEGLAARAAKVIDPRRIALNPDCGFAPDAGEPPTIDEAYEKLKRLAQAAARLRKRYSP